jgi:uncharacterized protein
MAARDQVMSSTERAPEPTMEEILASIRRIISDDESNAARQRPASTRQQDDEALEVAESEVDDRIINDIARVLSASQPQVEDDEDILDLTAELGGAESEEVLVAEVATLEVARVETFQPAPARIEPAAVEIPPVQVQPAPPPPPPLSASEEAASALERAIAALRAGQLPTSFGEFMPSRPGEPEPQSFAPGPEAAHVAEAAPEAVAVAEPELEAEFDLALPDFVSDTVVEETIEAPVEAAPEESLVEPEAPWRQASPPSVEFERPAVRSNGTHGVSTPQTSDKTLEDSVKDMLRPMLKQWLDENMPRMVTAALKDELGDRGMYQGG